MSHFLNLQSLGAFAFILGLLILIHELGHFVVAKLLGIHVEVFSLGFGPRLFGIQTGHLEGRDRRGFSFTLGPRATGIRAGGTDYRLSLLPLGGYVKMQGENPDEALSGDPREFLSRPKLQRFAVLVMGATTNIVAAVALMTGVYTAGVPEPAYLSRPAVVGAVKPDSPAAKAGILPKDRIVRLGSKEIRTWGDLQTEVLLSPGQETTAVLDRGGETLARNIRIDSATVYHIGDAGILPEMRALVMEVEPDLPAARAGIKPGDQVVGVNGEPISHPDVATRVLQRSAGVPVVLSVDRAGGRFDVTVVPVDRRGQGRIGIAWAPFAEEIVRKYPPGGALAASLQWNWKNVDLVFTTIGKLFSQELSLRTMSGPIDIYKISGQTFREGWIPFLQFMALVSLQLGVINLLPFPVLDGGHILILLIEGVMRRDLSLRIKERVMQVGFYLLLLLMGTIVYLDISKNFLE